MQSFEPKQLPETVSNKWIGLAIGLLIPCLLVLYQISQAEIVFDAEAAKKVDRLGWLWAFGEHRGWYVWVNIGVIIFPFLLSFDRRVGFYRHWGRVAIAIVANCLFFLPWDVLYAHIGVWGFNPRYYEHSIFGLPIGEYLFFLTVPYACVFVHECLNVYLPKDLLAGWDKSISISFILIFLIIGLANWGKIYTVWAFLLPAGLLLAHFWLVPNTYRTRFYLSYAVCLFPFLITNGILTGAVNQEPIVLYNDAHNLTEVLGTRCVTIPYDDFAYGFLLLFIPILIYEELRKSKV